MRDQEKELSEENLALIFKHIDKSFDEAQHTGQLNLSSKKLTGLPRSVTQFDLSDLHFADFSKNCLHNFPNFIFNFLSLEELDVHRNSIKVIPTLISQLKNLLILNTNSNQLTTFPAHACTLQHLQVLNLSSNRLCSLSPDLHLLSSLMLLDASNNLLTDLPESLNRLKSLRSLDLHKNQLTSLHPGLSELALISLNASVNHITHLPPTFHLLKTLENLNIDHNPLILPPPHVVVKGKEHVMAYMRRLKVEQNKRRLNETVVLRNPSKETPYAGSWSSTVLAHRRLDSDTCLNTHFTPSQHHNYHRNGSSDKPPYAISTIDVASHRRHKEAFKQFYRDPNASENGKGGVKDDYSSDSSRRERVYNHSSDKKPPFGKVPSFNSRQVSMINLSNKQLAHSSDKLSSGKLSSKLSSRSKCDDSDAESLKSFSSVDSNRTLSVGSMEGDRPSGSLKRNDTLKLASNAENDAVEAAAERDGGRREGVSIEETIKRTLINMQRQPAPTSNTNLKFNLSDSDGLERVKSKTPVEPYNSKGEVNDEKDDEEEDGDDDDDNDDLDVSDYEDGIDDDADDDDDGGNDDDDDDEEEEEEEEKMTEKRKGNFKQLKIKLPGNKQPPPRGDEEFVRKASDLRHQREFEARRIKKSLTSPPPQDSSGTNHVATKGLSQKCKQMLEAMSDKLSSQDPVLTIRRNLLQSTTERQNARKLKKTIEDLMHLRLHGDIGASLKDGVLLCKLANHVFPGSVPKIYSSSHDNQKLSEAKSHKNVENFLIACRKLGLSKDTLPTEQEIFEAQATSSLSQIVCHLVDTAKLVKQSSV